VSENQAAGKPPSRLRFTKNERLLKPSDFKRVFNRPVVSADRFFKVLARSGEQSGPRLGMAVSRQVDRRAVARNRLKRLIRESFRIHFAKGGPAADFVVLPRRESATICNRQLFEVLDRHWARLRARLEDSQKQH
jgi:ribonuclease P protein component